MRDIYVLDLHTHTYASGHAYNTMNEMVLAAKEKGLQLLGITDHAPSMPGTMGLLYFFNLKVARREKYISLIHILRCRRYALCRYRW